MMDVGQIERMTLKISLEIEELHVTISLSKNSSFSMI